MRSGTKRANAGNSDKQDRLIWHLRSRRIDIVRYFHTETLLISGAGCVLGVVLGLAGNVWMLTNPYGLARMNPMYMGVGALMVLGLSQVSVLWPALRAASLPPAIASGDL